MKNILITLLLIAVTNANAQTPLGTEFNYQGQLTSGGVPANGEYDIKFKLFDSQAASNQVGLDVIIEDIVVEAGLFTTTIDFGASIFIGDKAWLELNIREGDSVGGFTKLLPVQEITPTPYAIHAQFVGADAVSSVEIEDNSINTADIADNAINSTKIIDASIKAIDIDSTQIQKRVTNGCVSGSYINTINEDGSVDCVVDASGGGVDSVTSANIVDGTIVTVDIADNSIDINKLANNSVDTLAVLDNSITSMKITPDAINATHIASNSIGASEIISSEIQQRVSGTCSNGEFIKSVNQDGTLICATDVSGLTTVASSDIVDGTVATQDIADESITSNKIADSAVGSSEIISSQVQERVTGVCDLHYYLAGINQDGTVNCRRLRNDYYGLVLDEPGLIVDFSDIAIGVDGFPIISYWDNSNSQLKIVKCTTLDCNSFNTPIVLDSSGAVGTDTSIAIGFDDYPVISYTDLDNSSLKFVKCISQDCSSTLTPITIDNSANVGKYTSIAIKNDGNPIISYYDEDNGNLKVVSCFSLSCLVASTFIIDNSANDVGKYTSIAIGADLKPIISYFDDTINVLKVVKCSTESCSTFASPVILDNSFFAGSDTSLTIGVDNNPIVVYRQLNNLKLVKCTTQDCSFNETPLLLASGSVISVDVVIGSDNNPVISFRQNGNLKLIKCLTQNCSNLNAPLTLDYNGGNNMKIAIGTADNPIISYYSAENNGLKVYACKNTNCSE